MVTPSLTIRGAPDGAPPTDHCEREGYAILRTRKAGKGRGGAEAFVGAVSSRGVSRSSQLESASLGVNVGATLRVVMT